MWARGDFADFAGRPEPDASYDGSTLSGWLGADVGFGSVLGGLAVSYGSSESEYSVGGDAAEKRGRLEMTLGALYPYVGLTVADGVLAGVELRALFGAGIGEVRHLPGGGAPEETSALTMLMGAGSVARPVVSVGGFGLSARADGGFAQLSTASGPNAIDELQGRGWRVRLGVEAAQRIALAKHSTLAPFVEVAGRHDGGDGLAGNGLELAGGVRFTAPRVAVEARGRWLALHTQEGAVEHGVRLTARLNSQPDGTGLALALAPRWGAGADGADTLWRQELTRRAGNANPSAALDARIGYGFAVREAAGVLAPFAEAGLAADGARRMRIGTRFEASPTDLALELAAERRASPHTGPTHELNFDVRLRL